jgi:hypothetical protein
VTQSGSDVTELRLIKEERRSTQKCLQICAQLSNHIDQIQLTSKPSGSSPGSIDPNALPERLTSVSDQQYSSTPPLLANPMTTRTGVFFYANFNLSALLRLAGELRNTPCSCDSSRRPESGSWNWTVFLLFKDGVEWAFLSPRMDSNLSLETTAKLLESQVATMKYVKLNSSIPVPEVFDYR